ncbi:hypothetical protein I551_1846 [Mycobacterium ulcerans str. Harvey]|uniref:Uncharacterized protein n=1 Tax=Mycobacterium ulcerans str. Harvey TaxID=1299332 RepID=A0ABN0R409_MYCUL|nr:hypothetical protein I551_1846 [Mycobacterium ulcerans str. Harvey]
MPSAGIPRCTNRATSRPGPQPSSMVGPLHICATASSKSSSEAASSSPVPTSPEEEPSAEAQPRSAARPPTNGESATGGAHRPHGGSSTARHLAPPSARSYRCPSISRPLHRARPGRTSTPG